MRWLSERTESNDLQDWVDVLEDKERGDQKKDQEQAVVVEDGEGSGLELGDFAHFPQDLVVFVLLDYFLVGQLGGHFPADGFLSLLRNPFNGVIVLVR